MSYLLDTNICSAHMKSASRLTHRFIQHMGRLAISSVVLAELKAGAYMKADPSRLLTQIEALLGFVEVIDFDSSCAEEFGKVRGILHRQGISVQPIDLLIGSVGIAHDLTLVTNNTADFIHIPGLRLEDWLTP